LGGFAGLCLRFIIPPDWVTIWAALPGLLMVPVVTASPLGNGLDASPGQAGVKKTTAIIKMFAILYIASGVQILIGIILRELFNGAMPELQLYKPFGYEMAEGFAGGHGTAGVIGNYYKDLGLPYWETAQGLTATYATIGLIAGILIGIVTINVYVRRHNNKSSSSPLAGEVRWGVTPPPAPPARGGELFVSSKKMNYTLHLAIILAVCGIGYLLMYLVKSNKVPVINQLPIWVYGLVVMYPVNALIKRVGAFSRHIDKDVKNSITGSFTDYAILAAIASLPVRGIIAYWLPVLVTAVLGLLCTWFCIFGIARWAFGGDKSGKTGNGKADYPLERGLTIWGTMTGVFFTGLMLLKLADPEYKSRVQEDYSISFSMTTLSGFILMPLTVSFLLYQGFWANIALQGGITLIAIILLIAASRAKTEP
jgi:ESS family glutamate:Na+ symporter